MSNTDKTRSTSTSTGAVAPPVLVIKDEIRGGQIHCVRPGDPARVAAEVMDNEGIGALPVLKGSELVGVISERDLLRRAVIKRLDLDRTPVSKLMTTALITATPRDSLDACLLKMQARRCRHLPIVDGTRLVGFLSIRDALSLLLKQRSTEIRELKMYVWGQAIPGGDVDASWRCMQCGHQHDGDSPPDRCPICDTSSDQFQLIRPE